MGKRCDGIAMKGTGWDGMEWVLPNGGYALEGLDDDFVNFIAQFCRVAYELALGDFCGDVEF